jgi:hypothetical protein
MNNEKMVLMWHPTQLPQQNQQSRSPICVKVWIEPGVYLNDGTFVLPKLTWVKASQCNLPSRQPLRSLDLLDVCRILPTSVIDRNLHPFAITHKSFSIETQQEVILFQAHTTQERDRLVYGLKLVIARLASLLMLRDIRAAEEFFGAFANSVPGDAPVWVTQGKDDNMSSESFTRSGVEER